MREKNKNKKVIQTTSKEVLTLMPPGFIFQIKRKAKIEKAMIWQKTNKQQTRK